VFLTASSVFAAATMTMMVMLILVLDGLFLDRNRWLLAVSVSAGGPAGTLSVFGSLLDRFPAVPGPDQKQYNQSQDHPENYKRILEKSGGFSGQWARHSP
jgi:hypothetical protein